MPIRFQKVPLTIFQRFFRTETLGGMALLGFGLAALAIANSPLSEGYNHLWELPFTVGIAPHEFSLTLHDWINDGLMAVFFLLVGLEIKRELLAGELASVRQAALPIACAIGGMVVPALFYVIFNLRGPGMRGWGIPTATDIAFALGVLALLGRRVPASLKIFLTALAIIDDLGAVAIIAAFYTADLSFAWLSAAAATLAALAALNRAGVERLPVYLALGLVLWLFVLKSGGHATLAGVALAMTIPLRRSPGRPDDPTSPLHVLEHALQPWIAFGIVPIFGFANAGVSLAGIDMAAALAPVPLGIAAGLFLGKQIGVFLTTWAAVKLDWADCPEHASFAQVYGVSLLCGIGFTMSLFIGLLAFPASSELQDAVKIGVLSGSMLSAVVGALVLRFAHSRLPSAP